MKKFTTASILIGGAIMASQSVFGGVVANDLYFGFQNQAGSATSDYIINLGSASSLIGSSSVVDLSSDFSLSDFDAVLGGSGSLYAGVVGGSGAGNPSDIFATQLRVGNFTDFSAADSTAPGGLSRGQDNNAFAVLGNLAGPAAGTGALDSNLTWENYVEPTYTAGSFYGTAGLNPDSSIDASGILYEDLYETSSSSLTGGPQSFNYVGCITLDLSGANPVLSFSPAPTPEPGTYVLMGLGSLLLFTLRRRLPGQNA